MPTKEMFRFKVVDKYLFLFGVLKSTVLGFFALLVRELKRKVPFQNLYGAGHPTESLWQRGRDDIIWGVRWEMNILRIIYNVYIILLQAICQI